MRGGGRSSQAETGPTGPPWLDANGWILQLARARAPQSAVWIKSDPPENAARLTTEAYLLATAEAEAYGGRRALCLAPELAEALGRGESAAAGTWKALTSAAAWFEARKEINRWRPQAHLLVVSDFSGPNEYNATEVLNLAARRNLAFEPVETARLRPEMLKGRRAVLYCDAQPLPAGAASAVEAFVNAGGLLFAMAGPAKAVKGAKPSREAHPRFDLYDCGKGRVAAAKAEWDDPYMLAMDAHLLISRRWDPVRLYNASSMLHYETVSPDGKRWLAHVLNYGRSVSANPVTIQTSRRITAATFHSFETGAAQALEIHREPGQQEASLPRFRVYAAIELEVANG
jgi:hypothetical protein